MSAEAREPSADEFTLATIRQWAERSMTVTTEARRGTSPGGFRQAAFDVLAILEKHGRPPGEPVHFRSVWEERPPAGTRSSPGPGYTIQAHSRV